ncbi:MAG TPA: hypothetical protein VLG09_05660 [Candidatus Saccharimonadales bacterium]|nr:hypothetical protein [Candidatus Saccharimonadales bacterium]
MSIALAGISAVGVTAQPAQAVQSFNNAAVADAGLAELGTARDTGWNEPGECIKSVQRWVAAAGGYFGGGGVISGYVNSGAQEVSLTSAVKGDVIQYTNGNGNDQDWSHVHTVVVINNLGNGRFDIVQSNSPAGSGLVTRVNNWTPSPDSGWVSRVWQFGTATTTPPPPPTPVDTDGDGTPDSSDSCPTQAGPISLGGCPDGDFDGVTDITDKCPKLVGAPNNRGCRLDGHTVSGNFTGGDSYTDAVTFYDYGNNNLGAFVSQGSANGLGQPQSLWTTGTGQWSWGASSFYAGNFAGNDAYTDVIGLYDYGNGQLGAFLFQGNGNGVGQRQYLWTTSTNSWSHGNARYVVGNFAGNDGKDDILAFYGYENNNTGVSVLAGNGSGVNSPTSQWTTGPGVWNVKGAEYVAGNFAGNDAYTDVIAFYRYQADEMGAFLFQGSSTGLGQSQSLWSTGQQTWNTKNAQYFAGDFAGNDGVTDVMALYNLGNSTLGGYVMQGNGSGVSQMQNLWTTSANQWNLANTKAVAGQFAGSHTSLFGWYNYGSTTGGALFATASPISGVLQPQIKWTTTAGQWGWPAM